MSEKFNKPSAPASTTATPKEPPPQAPKAEQPPFPRSIPRDMLKYVV